MSQIDILMTRGFDGGLEPFVHDGLRVNFHVWDGHGPPPLLDGEPWAFVDWLLPNLSGLELCRRLRGDAHTEQVHLTMVLEEDDPEDRRRALRAGADDYILGPIYRQTVLDRVLAGQHGPREIALRALELGGLTMDLGALQVRWKGKPLSLMPNEFRLLRFFMERPGQVFGRAQLIAALGKHAQPIDERTVDAWVSRLRRALRDAGAGYPLRTVRSMGYVLDRP